MKSVSRIAGTAALAAAAVWAAGAMSGCHGQHPDRQAEIYKALNRKDMASVEVFENRNNGVITLKGIVGNTNNKTTAEQLVQQAAPSYKVDDQLRVDASGLMNLANPNARAPEMVQLAHPPVQTETPKAKHDSH